MAPVRARPISSEINILDLSLHSFVDAALIMAIDTADMFIPLACSRSVIKLMPTSSIRLHFRLSRIRIKSGPHRLAEVMKLRL
jgi:hypothetical protein